MENCRFIFSLKKKRFIIGRSASGQRVNKDRKEVVVFDNDIKKTHFL